MPISSYTAAFLEKRKSLQESDGNTSEQLEYKKNTSENKLLNIESALPQKEFTSKTLKKSHSCVAPFSSERKENAIHKVQQIKIVSRGDGSVHVLRTPKEKEESPDRICLDRRGLTSLPIIETEPKLKLLSLQHNLINNLNGFQLQKFPFLVFLDLYDNQLEKVHALESLTNLRVLLMGKNRIKRMEGFEKLTKMEVLDLHGNKITQIAGLSTLSQLKVLNLAGNQIVTIAAKDLEGLLSLEELNLKRNKLKKLLDFAKMPNLLKLFLSNNNIQTVEDMCSVVKATSIREISIENNPIFLAGDCVSFLVSYLPHLMFINNLQITEQVRKSAMNWRRNKELSSTAFMELTNDVTMNARREEIISNARTNWELLRSQTKNLTVKTSISSIPAKCLKPDSDFILTPLNNCDNKLQRLHKLVKNKVAVLPDKKLIIGRTSSQDTENSQTTSSSNTSSSGFFKLPPILVPFISKLGHTSEQKSNMLRKSSSLSSLGPNVDSSVSSLFSTTDMSVSSPHSNRSSISEEENEKRPVENEEKNLQIQLPDRNSVIMESSLSNLELKIAPVNLNAVETASSLSTNTSNSTSTTAPSSNSSSSISGKSQKNTRCIRSAATVRTMPTKARSRALTAKPKKPVSPAPRSADREREQGGDYLIEICGRHLNIYGQGALRFIEKQWNISKARDVTTVNFHYSNFNSIVGILSRVKQRFPNVEHFVFKETNIYCLGQLNGLAEIQGLTSVYIHDDGNPITQKDWKSYAIFRLSHWGLKILNGTEIAEEDIKGANEEYQSLSDLVFQSLPDVLLEPLLDRLHLDINCSMSGQNSKQWLLSIDPTLKSVVSKEALQWKKGSPMQDDLVLRQNAKLYMETILQNTCSAIYKLRCLDGQWPEIFQQAVRNILSDYSHMDLYMKKKMQEIKLSGHLLP